jgi:hypothetical protein
MISKGVFFLDLLWLSFDFFKADTRPSIVGVTVGEMFAFFVEDSICTASGSMGS